MKINIIDRGQEFEQTVHKRIYTLISPYFFDFLRQSFAEEEVVEPVPGLQVHWSTDHHLPRVIVEDLELNEAAQLFLQMYGNLLVEGTI